MPERVLSPKYYFYSRDGVVLKSIQDLAKYFKDIAIKDTSAFEFHFHNGGNDYANWVRYVFNNPELSDRLKLCVNVQEAIQVLDNFIKKRSVKQKPKPPVAESPSKEKKEESQENQDQIKEEIKAQALNELPSDMKTELEKFTSRTENKLDKVQRMKNKINEKIEETKEDEELDELYQSAYNEVSELRKSGKDAFIPSIKLRNIKPKMQYYKVSKKKEDYDNIKALIKDVMAEVEDAKKYSPRDFKAEIEAETAQAKNTN